MLGERRDRVERLVPARSLPVGEQLVSVQLDPLSDLPELTGWESSGEHLPSRSIDASLPAYSA